MIIANPVIDIVFKWLMDNKRIAHYFLETVLDETIVDVEVKPQEVPYYKLDDKTLANILAVIRLDFVATIKTENGQYKKVLIEIQKARNTIDVMRFRNYLAEQYKREDEIETDKGKKAVPLPIITIYMLGFKLQEIETPMLHVQRVYVDKTTKEIIYKKDDFAEKLTHDCFIVQIPRIEARLNNKINRLLSFFEQKYFIDGTTIYKDYPYEIKDEEMKMVVDELHYAATDPEKQKSLAAEKEALRVYNLEWSKHLEDLEVIAEQKKIIDEKEKAISEKDLAISEKEKALEFALKEIEELKKRLSGS